uniref:Gamma-glutamyltransferase 5 n=1 Tax=Sphenodon punctatus TaxID=8508 RepID=A0A8D0H3C3_SPHPU
MRRRDRGTRIQKSCLLHLPVAGLACAGAAVGSGRSALPDILQQGGSPVDAAIAALICTSVLNPQSMGLGGGVIFTIYNASTGMVEVINARETAPLHFSGDLLKHCPNPFNLGKKGVQWIGVPGELRGYEEAHKRHGRLTWKSLFEPTIKLLTPGVQIPVVLSQFLNHPKLQMAVKSRHQLFCDKQGNVLTERDTLHWSSLVETLKAVAEKGASEFYTGKVATKLVEDIKNENGSLTMLDLRNYTVKVGKPLSVTLGEYTMYSAPPPAGAAVLFFILNVLKGFNFTKESMNTNNGRIETYHRIAEALKFGNGQKPKLDDPQFSQFTKVGASWTFPDTGERRIDASGNHTLSYYNLTQPAMLSFGTSHVSVLAEDGSAVSVTSTINHPFGSMMYSPSTGIILNNELTDFCNKKPGSQVSPGERPPSAMSPIILVSKDKQKTLVIGGSGGDQIIPATALVSALHCSNTFPPFCLGVGTGSWPQYLLSVLSAELILLQAIMNKLWFGYDLEHAIAAPILHVKGNKLLLPKGFDEVRSSSCGLFSRPSSPGFVG